MILTQGPGHTDIHQRPGLRQDVTSKTKMANFWDIFDGTMPCTIKFFRENCYLPCKILAIPLNNLTRSKKTKIGKFSPDKKHEILNKYNWVIPGCMCYRITFNLSANGQKPVSLSRDFCNYQGPKMFCWLSALFFQKESGCKSAK